jgi:hypothetical protein
MFDTFNQFLLLCQSATEVTQFALRWTKIPEPAFRTENGAQILISVENTFAHLPNPFSPAPNSVLPIGMESRSSVWFLSSWIAVVIT